MGNVWVFLQKKIHNVVTRNRDTERDTHQGTVPLREKFMRWGRFSGSGGKEACDGSESHTVLCCTLLWVESQADSTRLRLLSRYLLLLYNNLIFKTTETFFDQNKALEGDFKDQFDFKWDRTKMRYLGVTITNNLDHLFHCNYGNLEESVESPAPYLIGKN